MSETTYPTLSRSLSASELRVLGTLIEKSLTTPEQYPLSLNATRVGCNQKTAREPVVNFDERATGMALRELIDLKLVKEVFPPDRGAVKYEHRLGSALDLRAPAVAALGMLFLRGAQTAAEIRQNCHRLHAFETVGHLEDVLERLSDRELVLKLERAPGQREERFVHLLGERDAALKQAAASDHVRANSSSPERGSTAMDELRQELLELRERVQRLEAHLGVSE